MSAINTSLLTNKPATPILPTKSLPNGSAIKSLVVKPTVTAPRIDLEPLYTALQLALGGQDWAVYKEALGAFFLGHLNQDELSRRVQTFIVIDAHREHLHNQFVAALVGNVLRDSPEPGVASWVSANDKPTTVSKPVVGDGAEQRLKTEVMALTGRERRRIKQIQEEPVDLFARTLQEYHLAKTIRPPDTGPASAGGLANKTNWELEIRKRYQQPLYAETNDFPEAESIKARMIPMCYEEGLVNGAEANCEGFMSDATEWFIKQVLLSIFQKVACNGENFIRTGTFKRRQEREDDMWLQGEIQKNPAGLLPCEIEENSRRRPLAMMDLKLALQLGDAYIGFEELLAAQVHNAPLVEYDDRAPEEPTSRAKLTPMTNGGPVVNGGHTVDAMDIDEDEVGWEGASRQHNGVLGSLLDDCLAMGE